MTAAAVRPVYWDEAEPGRLAEDLADMAVAAPGMVWDSDARSWTGRLPLWPFDRPRPCGLVSLVGEGMRAEIRPGAAHPLEEPAVFPLDVDIEVRHRLDDRWHVSGDGRLCLTRGPLAWEPEDRLGELVLKAAAWRCELALLQAGARTAMTVRGIVGEASLDGLFAYAALAAAGEKLL